MSKVLAILGSGHLGRQIANIAIDDKHYDKIVFFDDFSKHDAVNNHKIIGTSDMILNEFKNKSFDKLIIGIGYKHLSVKKSFFERFQGIIPFATIIHSSSYIDKSAIIKEGTVIYPSCCIDSDVVINENSVLNLGCVIAHNSSIGKHCFLSPRITVSGFVEIGDQCFVGVNTTVIDNIKIAKKTTFGGGTLVVKDIITGGLYVGSPAKFIK